ncbi:hypothetical protein BDN72DRAFT_641550 [Pluteus cervinus]|uniref:Uncharacterized protein n=1 Tax=Pluteus cervinus TaxID=181527 RepID=A0ACD3ATJ6_9AGAR|nr:hypothetical protein BDN72DRAFT_641550 [Pluteus cervinus]
MVAGTLVFFYCDPSPISPSLVSMFPPDPILFPHHPRLMNRFTASFAAIIILFLLSLPCITLPFPLITRRRARYLPDPPLFVVCTASFSLLLGCSTIMHKVHAISNSISTRRCHRYHQPPPRSTIAQYRLPKSGSIGP